MKIAIVTPQAVPLVLGGAENLWWGLQDYINCHTDHRCDLISLPSPEGTFWDLIDSYEMFSVLDLSAYDCIISGKYPAWMVKHPNHICYMLHRLRGLYDTYGAVTNDDSVSRFPRLSSLLEWMSLSADSDSDDKIPELFEKLRNLRNADLPPEMFAFPGPLSRAVVHFLDNEALSPRRIERYAAISETVKSRRQYFPEAVPVTVLHPPPHRDDYTVNEGTYFFTSSRLDRPKRVDLIIEAMKYVSKDISLLIAGTGPDEGRLKTLAGNDPRIRFLGFVADTDMPALYANAIAVPFVPYDEDYGLVTLEAMKSGKPVLTVNDSGGPCEFVRDSETGFVTVAEAEAFGRRLDKLANDAELAKKMGALAKASVASVNWENVVTGLLTKQPLAPNRTVRPKLTIATTFRVFPPMNGGQARIFYLYKNLAQTFDIDIISLVGASEHRSETEIAPGILEISIPQSERHAQIEHAISRRVDDIPVTDIVAHSLVELTPEYVEALTLSAMTSTYVVASHPYLSGVLSKAAPGKPMWYEAQDVEIVLKSALLGHLPEAQTLLEEVRAAERACWESAMLVFACKTDDLDDLKRIYGPTQAKLCEVPNGVAIAEIPYTPISVRRRLQRAAGIEDQTTLLFMGSWHGPNLEAVEKILSVAPTVPTIRFWVIGSVGLPFKGRAIPPNVELLGTVDQSTRNHLMALADAALNPMTSGSGTNLKMLDYFASGIPVISTIFGARGLNIRPKEHFIAADNAALDTALGNFSSMSDDMLAAMVSRARKVAESEYAWSGIAERFTAFLRHEKMIRIPN